MYTFEQFKNDWRRYHLHLDVEAEAGYYYDIYCKIARLSSYGKSEGVYKYWRLLKLMVYVETSGHLGLDKIYQQIYRLAEDSWKSLVESIEYDTWDDFYQAVAIVEDGIKNAPESALVKKLNEVVTNVDIDGLIRLLKPLVKYDVALFEILPLFQNQKEQHFKELLPNASKAFIKAFAALDNVLCWRDKEGYTVTQRLAECMRRFGYAEANNNLLAFKANSIDAYRVTEVRDNGVVAIENIKRTVIGEVTLLRPLPENYKEHYIVGITVQWNKLYLCEPYIWVPKVDYIRMDFDKFYKDMLEDIKDEIRGDEIYLESGKKVRAYDEFFGKGLAEIIGNNTQFNVWRLGENSPGYSENSLEKS